MYKKNKKKKELLLWQSAISETTRREKLRPFFSRDATHAPRYKYLFFCIMYVIYFNVDYIKVYKVKEINFKYIYMYFF